MNDWQYVDVVFRNLAYLQVLPNVPGRVVVRAGDYYSLVESGRVGDDVTSQYPP